MNSLALTSGGSNSNDVTSKNEIKTQQTPFEYIIRKWQKKEALKMKIIFSFTAFLVATENRNETNPRRIRDKTAESSTVE